MTSRFWRWLTSLNARGILLVVLAVLAGLVVWQVQIVLHPDKSALVPPSEPVADPPALSAGQSILRTPLIGDQAVSNLFTSPFLEKALEVRRMLGDFVDRPLDAFAPMPFDEAALNLRGERTFQPLPPVDLLYRGMMRRTDGVEIAFIDNLTTGTSHHYKLGDSLLGYQIQEIARSHVALGDGERIRRRLRVNEVQSIREVIP